jgi:predicted lipoprotein with Yx(FWY)xxD motif
MRRQRDRNPVWMKAPAHAVAVVASIMSAAVVAGAMTAPTDAGAASSPTKISTAQNKTWGKILVLGNGTAVYRLTADPKNASTCAGQCATVWPPVLLTSGQKAIKSHGLHGLGTITRSNGTRQVTYQGVPLYTFMGDTKSGQTTGNIKDTWGQWWVVNPAHPKVAPTAIRTSSGGSTPTTKGAGSVAY